MNLLNKFKRGMAALLSLSVAVSAVFVFHFPLIRAHADEDNAHSHPVGDKGGSITWEAWPPQSEEAEAPKETEEGETTEGTEEGETTEEDAAAGETEEGEMTEEDAAAEETEEDESPAVPEEDDEAEETEKTEEAKAPEYPALPDSEGYYYLTADVEIDKTWMPADGTYLCLNGKTITMTADASAVTVWAGSNFTLCDCTGDGQITHSEGCNGLGVENKGTFNLYSGAICGNATNENGAGVQNTGDFNMYGGEISRNTSTGGNGGGGVLNNGNFNMYGGTISENVIDNGGSSGGGVYNSGTFVMRGGKISNNEAVKGYGGGVHTRIVFEMYGGEITGNKSGDNGGGVYLSGNSQMTIGGSPKITGNITEVTGSEADSNVHIPLNGEPITISKDIPLCGKDTEIGVTTDRYDGKIAEATDGKNYRLFFEPDDKSLNATYKSGSEAQKSALTLSDTEPDEENEEVKPVKPSDSDEGNEGGDENGGDGDGDDENPGTGGNPALDDNHGEHETWKEISSADDLEREEGDSYFYVLTEDVELHGSWTPADGTVLCLNGKKLTIYGDNKIVVNGDFTLCDCSENKGELKGNSGNAVTIDGGKLAVYDSNISGTNGLGVDFGENDGLLTVGGKAKFSVDLPSGKTITIDDKKPLTFGAEITVKTADEPTEGNPVQITGANNKDYSEFFVSFDGYAKGYENKTVVFKSEASETPSDKHDPHPGDTDETVWEAVTDTLPTEAGHYYLTEDILTKDIFTPDDTGIILCLNGHKINTMISVANPNFTLCDCKGTYTATVTVGAGKTITVGGKLNANITLGNEARIAVSGGYPLTDGAKITISPAETLAEGASIKIKENTDYRSYFEPAKGYIFEVNEDGALMLKKTANPPVTPTGHTHPICGKTTCRDHINLEWEEWDYTTSLPTEAGSYYLTGNVTLNSRWNAASDINLCLNGYTITMNADSTVIYVTEDLVISDCGTRNSNGTITHAANRSGRGVYIATGAALTMYGGTIKGNRADDGAGVYNDGTFTMRGGYITGNTAANAGGGLYNDGFATVEGDISKNTASKKGGGVYQNGRLTVDAGAYIMQNTVGSSKNNVYLTDGSQIIIGSQFDGEVGVTLEKTPKSNSPVTFAKGSISSSTVNKLKSDSSSFKIVKSGSNLTLAKKSTSDSYYDDDDFELEISAPLSSNLIPGADRTAIINKLKDMPNWVVGAYYDVTLWDGYGDEVSEHTSYIDVELNIPSSIRASNGVYKVIRVHNGKATVLDDIDSDPNTVTVRSKLFSTYAIIYSVSQSGSASGNGTSSGTNSGTSSNGGYGNPSMGVQNEIPLAGLACGFTVMALAAPGKKLDQ